jgi:predicted acylesterase/phospholipase RssA
MNHREEYVFVKGKDGELKIPTKQRVLILQGGGALGAYEVGAFEEIYRHLETHGISPKNMFNIVAGVSAGAINAVLLLDYYIKNDKSWEGSPKVLEEFWKKLTARTLADIFIPKFWSAFSFFNPIAAHSEAARRYWSWYQTAALAPPFGGISPNLSNSMLVPDFKYGSLLNTGIFYDFGPLEMLLSANIKYPIQTTIENNEPRLLISSVDAVDCSSPVVFDSYPQLGKECKICNSKCEDNKSLIEHFNSDHLQTDKAKDIDTTKLFFTVYGSDKQKHVIRYNGIGQSELLSSCLFPYAIEHSKMYDHITKLDRFMWDGAFLNNTPLREVLQNHREFWLNYFRENEVKIEFSEDQNIEDWNPDAKPPDLEVYIVNLYPAIEENNDEPRDKDLIEDRMNDIRFCDRSKYDQKIAEIISDYIALSRKLINLATKKKASDGEIKDILNDYAKSINRKKLQRHYWDLLQGRFGVTVHRIDRSDDPYTISGKHADFSEATIEELIKAGIRDANKTWN